MNLNEYTDLDATGIARLLKNGDVSPTEVQDVALRAIEMVDPELHAVAGELFREPLAYDSKGAFAGVPFAIKDAVMQAEGVAHWEGTRATGAAGLNPPADTYLMGRFRRAGFATIARSRVPELAFNSATEPLAYDGLPTVNPWDVTRGAGGSSGGSGALVASRALPVAHANDGGGSIRIPAAVNGLVGLKPSRGRVSPGPYDGDPLGGMGIEFAVTRTVRDAAAIFDLVHGTEPGDRYLFPNPGDTFSAIAARGVQKKLKIALAWDTMAPGSEVDPQVYAATEDVARQLEALGHIVEYAAPAYDFEQFITATLAYWASFLAAGMNQLTQITGNAPSPEFYENATLKVYEHGTSLSAMDIMAAEAIQNQITRTIGRFFCDYDLILTPTLTVPNMPLGLISQNDPKQSAREYATRLFSNTNTAVYNLTGLPAVSLPLKQSKEDWPIGIQFAAPYGRDDLLLALARDLEEALPWASRTPRVYAREPGR